MIHLTNRVLSKKRCKTANRSSKITFILVFSINCMLKSQKGYYNNKKKVCGSSNYFIYTTNLNWNVNIS